MVLIAIGVSWGIDSQADCEAWAVTAEEWLLCRSWLHGAELSEGASGASLVYTLGLSFVEQVRWSSGVFWSWLPGVGVLEVLQCRPKSTAVCAQPEATQWKLQSDLWLVAASAQLGGSWGKLCCGPRLVATSTRLNTLWWAPQCGKRPAIYCARFMAT